jgi:septal ring-binding cell division protein DamX
VRKLSVLLLIALAACRDEAPPSPTSAEAEQLDEAEAMLNDLAKEEGPEQSPGPSNRSN